MDDLCGRVSSGGRRATGAGHRRLGSGSASGVDGDCCPNAASRDVVMSRSSRHGCRRRSWSRSRPTRARTRWWRADSLDSDFLERVIGVKYEIDTVLPPAAQEQSCPVANRQSAGDEETKHKWQPTVFLLWLTRRSPTASNRFVIASRTSVGDHPSPYTEDICRLVGRPPVTT